MRIFSVKMSAQYSKYLLVVILGLLVFTQSCGSKDNRILIFTKVDEKDGFRHESIEKGVETVTFLADRMGFKADHTENDSLFNPQVLQQYEAVVFLNTSRNVLNEQQQVAFEQYIRSGKGFLGIHGATTTEYDWPWFGRLVGAYFLDHPEIQEATLKVTDMDHPSTESLPETWIRTDEWYNFRDIKEDLNVVLTIDETSYEGGKNGNYHPMAWYHEFEGGRSFYTALGHSIEAYDEPEFRKHLKGALQYVLRVE